MKVIKGRGAKRRTLCMCQQLLQEEPHPPPVSRLEVSLKPEPLAVSMKSRHMGRASARSFLSTRKVIPLFVKISSLPCDSSRAIPNEGPPQPACKRMRTEGASGRFLRKSLIISIAFSVASNIFPPLVRRCTNVAVNLPYTYARRWVLSTGFFRFGFL